MLTCVTMTDKTTAPANPLLSPSDLPHGYPRFNEVRFEHFEPALRAMMLRGKQRQAEIVAKPASFENTILGFESNGDTTDVGGVYGYHLGNLSTPELRDFHSRMSQELSAYGTELAQDPAKFALVDAVHKDMSALDPVQQRLVNLYYDGLVDSGAALPPDEQVKFKELSKQLAGLSAGFNKNLINERAAKAIHITDEADLAGVPENLKKSLAENAKKQNKNGFVLLLNAESVLEFLRFADNRALRQQVWETQQNIGNTGGDTDNMQNVRDIVATRQQIAGLLGYEDFATFALKDRLAKTPAAAMALLTELVPPARKAYEAELAANTALAHAQGFKGELQPWDWHYYARQHEEQSLGFRDEDFKPYLELGSVRRAFFTVCRDVFGVSFTQRHDLPLPHPDVQVWEAKNPQGEHIGLLMTDDFARAGEKNDGAWMSRIHNQNGVQGQRGIITNTMNFSKPAQGEPCLLTFNAAVTLFHEGGHALHGLLSNSPYPSMAGTNVPRDIVELPSQFMESMLHHPMLMARHLKHHETGEPIPQALIDKVQAKLKYGQGYRNLRQLSFGICDLELYGKNSAGFDPQTFEQETLDRHGFPAGFRARPMLQSFSHIMSGGYAAGYYSYMWADVPAADAAEAFAANPLDPVLGASMAKNIYASGNTRDVGESYRAFRGRDPDPKALLRQFGWN